MSKRAQRVADYLGHILAAIARIERYIANKDEIAFSRETMTQDAVIRNLEIIGEACRNIDRADPGFAQAHPEIPLSIAYEMRNALARGYFKVDLAMVWRTVERDLPRLRETVGALRRDLRRDGESEEESKP
jgi:uncharacterized protein with HEPN domain